MNSALMMNDTISISLDKAMPDVAPKVSELQNFWVDLVKLTVNFDFGLLSTLTE